MLPFIQLDQDFIHGGSVLIAAALKLERNFVLGMGAILVDFTIRMTSTEEKPPDGLFIHPGAAEELEGVMGWRGEPGRCVDAFVRAGVIERREIGLRVRGTDRYADAWRNAQARTEKAKAAALARWGRNSADVAQKDAPAMLEQCSSNTQAMLHDAKTQTQKQTHITTKPPNPLSGEPGGGKENLELLPQEQKPPTSVEEVMAHYREVMVANGRTPRETARGRRMIAARLNEGFSVAELKEAINGLTWSDFHRNSEKYFTLKYAVRSSDQVEMMMKTVPPDRRSA